MQSPKTQFCQVNSISPYQIPLACAIKSIGFLKLVSLEHVIGIIKLALAAQYNDSNLLYHCFIIIRHRRRWQIDILRRRAAVIMGGSNGRSGKCVSALALILLLRSSPQEVSQRIFELRIVKCVSRFYQSSGLHTCARQQRFVRHLSEDSTNYKGGHSKQGWAI